MGRVKGWVSFPIIIFIAILSGLLLEQNRFLGEQQTWQSYYQSNDYQAYWYEVGRRIRQMPNSANAACNGFCAPWDQASWRQTTILSEQVLYQVVKDIDSGALRWCATQNQRTFHCWWRRQNITSYGILTR